jgi:hypothetical protein
MAARPVALPANMRLLYSGAAALGRVQVLRQSQVHLNWEVNAGHVL